MDPDLAATCPTDDLLCASDGLRLGVGMCTRPLAAGLLDVPATALARNDVASVGAADVRPPESPRWLIGF
jgi:hypothetical protein